MVVKDYICIPHKVFLYYRPPEGVRSYNIKVESRCAFLQSYYERSTRLCLRKEALLNKGRVLEREQL